MNYFVKHAFGMHTAVILLFVFGIASGVATFIENDFGTETAWAVVYASHWFAAIQVWLGINLFYNLFRYNLFQKEKLPLLIFHISFICILVGAGLTRYFGFEGSLHIREGKMANRVVSYAPFIQLEARKDGKTYYTDVEKLISRMGGGNDFTLNLDIAGKEAVLDFKRFVPNAVTKVVSAEDGKPIISMTLSEGGQPEELTLHEGDVLEAGEAIFIFGNKEMKHETEKPIIRLYVENGKFFMKSSQSIGWFKMIENKKGAYTANEATPFVKKQLYTIGHTNFAPKEILLKGKETLVSQDLGGGAKTAQQMLSAIVADLSYNGETKEVILHGTGRGQKGYSEREIVGGQMFKFEWGSKVFDLPFYIQLIDFQLDRYPGSMSPSSYASEVKVVDKEKNVNMPYRIYMNHVLDYRGFRFFQSSYDRDELGTVLSVNQDPGKWPTYIGYILLGFGLLFNIINPKSRFRDLARKINRDATSQKGKMAAVLFAMFMLFAPESVRAAVNPDNYIDYLKKYEKSHADKFGTILVQSADGRIKPIDTISQDVFNKVYRKSTYKGITPNQAVLGMMSSPAEWQIQPMIKVFHPELKKIIGVDEKAKYASFNDFFEKEGNHAYKLSKYTEVANRKKPAQRNKFDKDVLKVDERLNVCYYVYTGEIFKMIPKVGDPNKMWYSPKTAIARFPKAQSDEVRSMLAGYFEALSIGLEKGSWAKADKAVDKIKAYQTQYAADIIPSQSRVNTEIAFNHYKIFQKLTPVYLLAGFVLLIFIFIKMLAPKVNLKWVTRTVVAVNSLAFIAHTIGLGLRWYIAEHAPWSDSYESMIYIAWALSLSGIAFSRQSPISLSLTSILAGVTLFVAHLSWMDPQITNLVPVLKSYWLTIHVSVITASYGFLGLCALLGFFTLILFIVRNPKVNDRRGEEIDRNITEATRINEMSMILGLSLLTLGNFLGGVWANESWGRYWGWDAKETWSLVSILVYAVIVHFRFVPKLNTQYAFAVASSFAYWSIIMTYFGVNFYLSGMHSYAAGDPVPVPTFVPITALVMVVIAVIAYFKRSVGKRL